jgi:hypothetical protein
VLLGTLRQAFLNRVTQCRLCSLRKEHSNVGTAFAPRHTSSLDVFESIFYRDDRGLRQNEYVVGWPMVVRY